MIIKKKFNNKKYFIYKHHWTSWEKLKKDSKYLEAENIISNSDKKLKIKKIYFKDYINKIL